MRKIFTSLFAAAALLWTLPTAEAAVFETEYNFDNDNDFAEGSNLPDGWAYEGSTFLRKTASYFGFNAPSGNYILGKLNPSFNEVIFTPMVNITAGSDYTLELKFIAPGNNVRTCGFEIYACTEQNSGSMTFLKKQEAGNYTDWTDASATFTAETAGEYCFAIKVTMGDLPGQCGTIAFDDIFVSGDAILPVYEYPEIELEPDPENLGDCVMLPYFEFFDGEHYDGTSYLPVKWHSVGSTTWITASVDALKPVIGDYYMITYHNTEFTRDDIAFTPFFELEANKEYTITFACYIQGNDYNEEGTLTAPVFNFTVGTQQDSEFHNSLLRIANHKSPTPRFENMEVTFTPQTSGAYCFSFALSGEKNTGIVAIDNFRVTAPGLIASTEPSFSVNGIYNLMNSQLTTFPESPVQLLNTSLYADSYQWEISGGAIPAESTDENPWITFPHSGKYLVSLTASNERGSRTARRTIDVTVEPKGEGGFYPLMNYSDNDRMYDRGKIPAYETDAADYITGPNHYYLAFADRFDLPESATFNINQISIWIAERLYREAAGAYEFQYQYKLNMFVKIYGADANGDLDPNKVLAILRPTVGDIFGEGGMGGISGEMRSIDFPIPPTVKGRIYIALELPDGIALDPEGDLARTSIGVGCVRFENRARTTLWARPTAVSPASTLTPDGETWYPIDQIDPEMKGFGTTMTLWMTCVSAPEASLAYNSLGEIAFAARFDGNTLYVSGTVPGNRVTVHDISGRMISSKTASSEATAFELPVIPSGVYVVSNGKDSIKVVK